MQLVFKLRRNITKNKTSFAMQRLTWFIKVILPFFFLSVCTLQSQTEGANFKKFFRSFKKKEHLRTYICPRTKISPCRWVNWPLFLSKPVFKNGFTENWSQSFLAFQLLIECDCSLHSLLLFVLSIFLRKNN